jgi:hypothetical protein
MENEKPFTRRNFLAAGGAGAMAFARFAAVQTHATPHELTAAEKANIEIVDAFHRNMSDPAQNLDNVARLAETCADNIIWGTAGGEKLHGLAAVQEWYTNFFKGGGDKGLRRMQYEYWETFARGPVVVEYGLHFVIPPGGPKPAPTNIHCVVHVIRNGKISERYDQSAR